MARIHALHVIYTIFNCCASGHSLHAQKRLHLFHSSPVWPQGFAWPHPQTPPAPGEIPSAVWLSFHLPSAAPRKQHGSWLLAPVAPQQIAAPFRPSAPAPVGGIFNGLVGKSTRNTHISFEKSWGNWKTCRFVYLKPNHEEIWDSQSSYVENQWWLMIVNDYDILWHIMTVDGRQVMKKWDITTEWLDEWWSNHANNCIFMLQQLVIYGWCL